jgi:hypothetical protein
MPMLVRPSGVSNHCLPRRNTGEAGYSFKFSAEMSIL